MSKPITAALVNELRKRTDLPMMECKSALQATGGDIDAAIDHLRKAGAKASLKRAGNETAEGRIGVHLDNAAQVGAIVELRCESAPVAKGEHFVKLANEIAKVVAAKNPADVDALLTTDSGKGKTVTDLIHDVIAVLRENMKVQRFTRLTGGMFGEYVHHDGTLGVLLQVKGSGANPGLLRDVCMHIAAVQPTPVAARREEVDPALVAKEKEIAKAKAEATGKPPQIAEKIAEGQRKAWYAENVLAEQPFVKDQAKTVGQVLKEAGLEVTRFVRYKVGEVPA
ncbi:MAG: translation elongation factor Ts [Zavarzinella sp.]|nr:translation elongation factor Ts [Zavarzinella sp.]